MGRTIDEFGEALFAGKSCIGELEGYEIEDQRFRIGGQLKDFDISQEMADVDTKRTLRYSQFSLVAAQRAIADAALPLDRLNRDRIGTSFSTAAAGLGETIHIEAERFFRRGDRGVSPLAWAEFTPCACTTHVAIRFGLRGPIATHSSGCVSGVDAIAWGVSQIREGKADVMVVGGADAPFFKFIWAGLYRSGILAPDPGDGRGIPRPFSRDHNGIVLVEGGSAIVLESAWHAKLRGAGIYAEVQGIASVEEARPLWDLDPNGHAYAVTIKRTLEDARLRPSEIDWLCAHGTGYPGADVAESRGIQAAMGDAAFCVPVSSVRGAIGQSFASGGALQAACAYLAIKHQKIPATLNFTEPDDDCRLDFVPNEPRVARVRRVLVCTAGVGGTHAGMVIGAYEE
jgi:3-oxoacyl-(acyl-carrier-protein) synthase